MDEPSASRDAKMLGREGQASIKYVGGRFFHVGPHLCKGVGERKSRVSPQMKTRTLSCCKTHRACPRRLWPRGIFWVAVD